MSTKTLDTRARYCLNMSQSDENPFPTLSFLLYDAYGFAWCDSFPYSLGQCSVVLPHTARVFISPLNTHQKSTALRRRNAYLKGVSDLYNVYTIKLL